MKLLIQAKSGNSYLFDYQTKNCIFVPPAFLNFLLHFQQNFSNPLKITAPTNLDRANFEISEQDISYFNSKIQYLTKNNYLCDLNDLFSFNNKLTGSDVQYSFVNTPQVLFEITEKCNLSCKYCGYGEFYYRGSNRLRRDLKIENVKVLLNYLCEMINSDLYDSINKGISIGFYGGEPLLRFDMINEIVDYCSSLKLNNDFFKYNITTNGLLLDKYFKYFLENNFEIKISIDGDKNSNIYRRDHNGIECFEKVFNNIRKIKEYNSEYFDNNVFFQTVLHNMNSIKSIYSFFKDNFNKLPFILPLNNSGIIESKKEEFMMMYRNYNESLFESKEVIKLDNELFELSARIMDIAFFIHSQLGYNYSELSDLLCDEGGLPHRMLPTGTCFPFGKKIYLTVEGNILPCERVDNQYILGEVNKGKVNIDFDNIAQKYNNYYLKTKYQCETCYLQASCKQCLFFIPDVNSDCPICKSHMSIDSFYNYVNGMINELENNCFEYLKIINEIRVS